MKSIKQLSNQELNKLLAELDGAIEDYEKLFEKDNEDVEVSTRKVNK